MRARRLLLVTTVACTLEAFFLPWVARLRRSGWEVELGACGVAASDSLVGVATAVHELSWSRNPWDFAGMLESVHKVRQIVSAGDFDIVHVNTPIASLVVRFALRGRRGSRPQVIYTAHGFHFFVGQSALRNWIFRSAEEIAAGWTDWLVTMNAEDFSAARTFNRIDLSRVRLIPGVGLDCERYRPLDAASRVAKRSELDLESGDRLVTMIAEFTPNKSHDLALATLDRLPADVVMAFLGEGKTRTRAELTAAHLGRRARFLGWRADANEIAAASDVVVLVSRREGLPRAVMEALACEVPVVGTRTRGLVDIVTSECGALVADRDPDELARAILGYLDDAGRREEAGSSGRARVCSLFGEEPVLGEYEHLYQEVLNASV